MKKTIISATIVTIALAGCAHPASNNPASNNPAPDRFTSDDTAEKYYEKGTMALQCGDWRESIAPLSEAIKHDPSFVAAFINRSKSHNELKEYKEALEDANSALKYNSTSSYALYHKARAEQGLEQYIKAASDFKAAAENEPEASYKYLQKAAECLKSGGKNKEAGQLLDKLANANDAPICVGRGMAKYEQNKFSESIAEFDKAIAKDDQYADGYYNRGLSKASLGEYHPALYDFNKTISLDHDYLLAYYLRGLDQFYMGNYQASLDDLRYFYAHNGQSEGHSNYSVIVATLDYRKLRLPTKELLSWWQPYQGKKWPAPILDYLAGTVTADSVIAGATDGDKMTEAKTYLGIVDSIDGKTKEAKDYLSWVKENGNRHFGEYQLAVSELDRLNESASEKAK